MMDFEIAQRLARMQERLKAATYRAVRAGDVHKTNEGAMELCFHLPSVLSDDDAPFWSVWAYSYLFCPDGREERWFGKSPAEAISKAEDAIRAWCFASEMEDFERDMGDSDRPESPE